jgi:hypothetical protein
MKKVLLVFAIALTAVFLALSQTNGSHAKKSQLDGTWSWSPDSRSPKEHGISR